MEASSSNIINDEIIEVKIPTTQIEINNSTILFNIVPTDAVNKTIISTLKNEISGNLMNLISTNALTKKIISTSQNEINNSTTNLMNIVSKDTLNITLFSTYLNDTKIESKINNIFSNNLFTQIVSQTDFHNKLANENIYNTNFVFNGTNKEIYQELINNVIINPFSSP